MERKIISCILILSALMAGAVCRASAPQDIFKELEKKKRKTKSISARKSSGLENGWTPRVVSGILMTQSSYTNWNSGGENSLAWTLTNDDLLVYKQDALQWSSELNLAFGQTRVGDQRYRKTEDRFEFESTVSKKLRKFIRPFISAFMQTQLAPGYKYRTDKDTDQEIREQISGFWDPAFLYQSVGLSAAPMKGFEVRLGLAAKETVTRRFNSYTDGNWYNVQSGMELVSEFNRKILKDTRLKSNLRLFSSFRKFEEVQMVWDTRLSLKFNRFFSANVRTYLVYEPDVSLSLQIKEILGIGVEYSFFD